MSAEQAERFDPRAMVKGTMVRAHLGWALHRLGNSLERVQSLLSGEPLDVVTRTVLATDWVRFEDLVAVDRAIARAVGGDPEEVFRELGRHSAALNLQGVYRSFVSAEPHRFFERMTVLHHQFQSFGKSGYERLGERAGRIRLEEYTAYSRVFCLAGRGYYEEALRLMHVPGPVRVEETACLCLGAPACVYELSW